MNWIKLCWDYLTLSLRSYTMFVITPNGLGIASCWALARRQGEISACRPEEEGQNSNFPTQDVQAL